MGLVLSICAYIYPKKRRCCKSRKPLFARCERFPSRARAWRECAKLRFSGGRPVACVKSSCGWHGAAAGRFSGGFWGRERTEGKLVIRAHCPAPPLSALKTGGDRLFDQGIIFKSCFFAGIMAWGDSNYSAIHNFDSWTRKGRPYEKAQRPGLLAKVPGCAGGRVENYTMSINLSIYDFIMKACPYMKVSICPITLKPNVRQWKQMFLDFTSYPHSAPLPLSVRGTANFRSVWGFFILFL